MKRALAVILLVLALAAPALAQTVQQLRIEDSLGHVIVGATVKIYPHGVAHTAPNLLATGITDVDGYVQPPPSLNPGTQYDFTTTDARVPNGSFTAVAASTLVLIPGHGSTATTASATMVAPGNSLTLSVGDAQAFPIGSWAVLADSSAHVAFATVTAQDILSVPNSVTLSIQMLGGGATNGTVFASGSSLSFSGPIGGLTATYDSAGLSISQHRVMLPGTTPSGSSSGCGSGISGTVYCSTLTLPGGAAGFTSATSGATTFYCFVAAAYIGGVWQAAGNGLGGVFGPQFTTTGTVYVASSGPSVPFLVICAGY